MVWLMRRCVECKKYALINDVCPFCEGKLIIPHPAKFSPDDKYLMQKGMMRNLKNERDRNNRKGTC
jgi:H/ACA ribonucleoprotein complex subunit 3